MRSCGGFPLKPTDVAADHPAFIGQPEEVNPAVVDEMTNARVLLDDAIQRVFGGCDEDVEPQRFMHEALAVVDRLPGQSHLEVTGVALQHPQLPDDVVPELNTMKPLMPFVPAATVLMWIDPLVEAVPDPVRTVMVPPVWIVP